MCIYYETVEIVLINPLYPPILGDFFKWGTPPDPRQREIPLDSLYPSAALRGIDKQGRQFCPPQTPGPDYRPKRWLTCGTRVTSFQRSLKYNNKRQVTYTWITCLHTLSSVSRLLYSGSVSNITEDSIAFYPIHCFHPISSFCRTTINGK